MAGTYKVQNEAIKAHVDRLVARARHERDMANIRYELAKIRKKLERIGPNPMFLDRARAYRLTQKADALNAKLDQLALPL